MQSEIKQDIQEDHLCSICLDLYLRPSKLNNCSHTFCRQCLTETAAIHDPRCPLCRTPFTLTLITLVPQFQAMLQKLYPNSMARKQAQVKERVMISFIVGNTSKLTEGHGSNNYQWQFYVKSINEEEALGRVVDTVEVHLHPTFHPSRLKYHPKGAQPIRLTRIGWGTFRIDLTVHWKGNFQEKTSEFHHDLMFIPQKQNIVSTFLTPKK